jgi:hypothetical protein
MLRAVNLFDRKMTPSNKKRPFTSQSHNRKLPGGGKPKKSKSKHHLDTSKGKMKKALPSYMQPTKRYKLYFLLMRKAN